MNNYKIETKVILPDYKNLKNHVEIFRKQLQEESKITKENELKKEYFNNISILGDRGTGKTSILYSLYQELSIDKENIVFELITPEIINKEEDILGWLIVLLSEKVNELQSNIKGKCDLYKEETPLTAKLNKLKSSYFIRRDMYNSIIENQYSNKSDYIMRKDEKLAADVKLRNDFQEFINEFIKSYQGKNKIQNALLIFIFDDVDIYSSRITEVLNIIMKYLSHENIVSYIAGDYNGFIENITLELLKQENLLSEGLMNITVLDDSETIKCVRRKRAYELLKKVLPPKNRYKIPLLTNECKYEIIKHSNSKSNINRLIEFIKNDICYEDNEIIYEYLDFMDNKIRGFMNIIDFINNQDFDWDSLENNNYANEEYNKKTINLIKNMLEKIVDSSQILEDDKELIEKVLNIPSNDFISIKNENLEFIGYINYSFIREEMVSKHNNKSEIMDRNTFERIYKIFILCNFIEIVIVNLKIRDKETIHGEEELIEILNSISSNAKYLFPKIDLKSAIYLKEKLFSKLKYQEIQRIYSENSSVFLRTTYLDIFKYYKKDKNLCNVLKLLMNEDDEWTKEQIDWIYEVSYNEQSQIKKSYEKIILMYKDIEMIEKLSDLSIEKLKIYSNKIVKVNDEYNFDIEINNIEELADFLSKTEDVKKINSKIDYIEDTIRQLQKNIKQNEDKIQMREHLNTDIIEEINKQYKENIIYFNENIEVINDIQRYSSLDKFPLKNQRNIFIDTKKTNVDNIYSKITYLIDKLNIEFDQYYINISNDNRVPQNYIMEHYYKVITNRLIEKCELFSREKFINEINDYNNKIKNLYNDLKKMQLEREDLLQLSEKYVKNKNKIMNGKNYESRLENIIDISEVKILNKFKEIRNKKEKLLQLELTLNEIYLYAKKNIYNIKSISDIDRAPAFIKRDFEREIFTNEIIKKILGNIDFFKRKEEEDMQYEKRYKRSELSNRERMNRLNNVLDIEMDLLNELDNRKDTISVAMMKFIENGIPYLVSNYILIDLELNQKEMESRAVNKYINQVKETLSKKVRNEKRMSRIREYLRNKEN